jgi:hypothetical protein
MKADGAHSHGGGGVAAGFAALVAVAFVVEVLADWLWLMLACTVAAGAGLVVLGVRLNRGQAAAPLRVSRPPAALPRGVQAVSGRRAGELPQVVHYHQHLHVHPAELAGNPDPKENP